MADLIIKPEATSGNKLILKDQAGGAVLTTADSGATVANATLTGATLDNATQDSITRLGTVTTGTYNATIGSSATFPTAVGGGAGGHVVCIKRSTHNTETSLSTSWATTFGNITHTMSDANNILFLQMHVPILVYHTNDTRGQVGFSKDNAAPFSSSGGYGYWQQQSGDPSSHSVKHCVWSEIVTPGDTSSHTWGMSAIEHAGTAIAMWNGEAPSFLILMEMTGD